MELRQTLRLEQRLTMSQIWRMHGLEEEKEYLEQRTVLENMRQDLDAGVYDNVQEFSNRLMKRIKKKDRTEAVQALVSSVRALIEYSEKQHKTLSLPTLRELVELGITSVDKMYLADKAFTEITSIADKVNNSLEEIVQLGTHVIDDHCSVPQFYGVIKALEQETAGAVPVQEGYDRFQNLLFRYLPNRKIIGKASIETAEQQQLTSKIKVDLFFSFLEQLCELAVPQDEAYQSIKVSPLLELEHPQELQEKYGNLPLPILTELLIQKVDESVLERMNQFAGTKDMRNSRDNKRAYLSSLMTIRARYEKGVVADVITKSTGMKQARDILTKFAGMCKLGIAHYDFTLPTGEAIMDYLERKREFKNPVLNKLSEAAIEKLRDVIRYNRPSDYSYEPLLKLGDIYEGEYPQGIALLASVMESMLMDNFITFRYQSPETKQQLAGLNGSTEEWRKNTSQRRILGDLEGTKPTVRAILQLNEQLKLEFKNVYQEEPSASSLEVWSKEKTGLIEDILKYRKLNVAVPVDLDEKIDQLNEKIRYAYFFAELDKMQAEKLPDLAALIASTIGHYQHPVFQASVDQLVAMACSPEVGKVRPISIRDTDDPNYLIDVGCTPVKSCQRWTEKTAYNDCLPAYITDANKRLVQALDQRSRIRVRSILRLMEVEELNDTPVLFVEGPYADIVSDDLYKALLGSVVEKAYRMNKEVGKPIAVAVEHQDYCRLLKEMAKKGRLEYKTKTFTTTFPSSRNGREYSDAFGSRIMSGTTVSCPDVGYIIIDANE